MIVNSDPEIIEKDDMSSVQFVLSCVHPLCMGTLSSIRLDIVTLPRRLSVKSVVTAYCPGADPNFK